MSGSTPRSSTGEEPKAPGWAHKVGICCERKVADALPS